MIVCDTNLLVALAVAMPQSHVADAVWQADSQWATTPLWESEFRNVLVHLIKKKVVSHDDALAAFRFASERVNIYNVSSGLVLKIALEHKLTAYDSEFAALAEWLDVPCVSWDKDLIRQGRAMSPEDFLKHSGE